MNLCLLLQEEQKDRVLSTSEDPLPHHSKADTLIQSQPLSDLYPFNSQPEKGPATYLLTGCGTQAQSITAGPDENRLNGINSSAWSSPVIGQPEGKPYSSRIMKLFSNSRKGPIPAHYAAPDSGTSTSSSSNGAPLPWSGLSGLGVVDSFKKLRSSVLQGIQSRGAIINEGEPVSSPNQDIPSGTGVLDEYSVSNGNSTDQNLVTSQGDSDIKDYYDDDDDEIDGDGLTRNTVFSRSIRRAYGAGRISVFDMGSGRLMERSTSETADSQKTGQKPKVNPQSEKINENTNVKMLSRLSKSAENLHIFKAPFRRTGPCSGPTVPATEPQGTVMAQMTTGIQRTASMSSVDFQDHTDSQRKSPLKTKVPMLKLVGNVTDLTVRRRQSPSPSPTSPSLMSPLSRLHDDYSRRVPCLTTTERQRRPSPIRARVLSVGHTPVGHPQPAQVVNPQEQQVYSPASVEPSETTDLTSSGKSAHHQSLTEATTAIAECDSTVLSQKEPSQQKKPTEVAMLPEEVRE